MTHKASYDPKYRGMGKEDISEAIGYESSNNVKGYTKVYGGELNVTADLDSMDSYEAKPLVYGGKPRAIGGTDSIVKYKTKEMKSSIIVELL